MRWKTLLRCAGLKMSLKHLLKHKKSELVKFNNLMIRFTSSAYSRVLYDFNYLITVH